MEPIQTINLRVDGLGIILYSPFAVAHIEDGSDYYSAHHLLASQVVEHTNRGTIVDLATGSPGRFIIRVFRGEPRVWDVPPNDKVLRLGIEVRDGEVHVRDVYDLMEWCRDTPPAQIIGLEDGFHAITATSGRPASGFWGDNQVVDLWFHKVPSLPRLAFHDIPALFD